MHKTITIFLPLLLCCCLTSTVLCQRNKIYYHYPVPRNPVSYNTGRLAQRQVYEHYVPQTVARHYQQHVLGAATSTYPQVVQQFHAPELENAAFLGALSQHALNGQESAPASSQAAAAAAAVGSETYSLNVQLPLPLGVAPISAAPLPLQAGGSFNGGRNYVTSYGTREVQRVKK